MHGSGHTGPEQRTERTMSPLVQDAFMARARLQPVVRKQVVIAEGSPSRDVYLIISGRLLFSLISPQGREVILNEMGPGEMFGELSAIDGLPRSTNVTAVDDGKLAQLTGPEFTQFLAEVPQAGLWVAQQLAQRVRSLTERAFELATLPVASRVQAELLRLAQESAEPGADFAEIHPMPTHADLAARIGTSREAVSRELGLLGHEGVLHQNGRQLLIASIAGLRALYERLLR